MKNTILIPVVQCTQCQTMGFPPMYVCRKCGSTIFEDIETSGLGNIYTHTTIRIAPDVFKDQVPYDICIVELKPNLRVTSRINTPQAGNLRIGDQVVYEKVDQNGYWFTMVD